MTRIVTIMMTIPWQRWNEPSVVATDHYPYDPISWLNIYIRITFSMVRISQSAGWMDEWMDSIHRKEGTQNNQNFLVIV
jgi:hypothetical protein